AAPGVGVGYLQGGTKLDNLVFAEVHERGFEAQVGIAESCGSNALHAIEGRDEFRATIRVNEVVARVDAHGDELSFLSDGDGVCDGEHHGVAIGHDGDGHRGGRVVTVGDGNGIGEG